MTEKGDNARAGDDGREGGRRPRMETMAERGDDDGREGGGGGTMAERRTMAENGDDDREWGRC